MYAVQTEIHQYIKRNYFDIRFYVSFWFQGKEKKINIFLINFVRGRNETNFSKINFDLYCLDNKTKNSMNTSLEQHYLKLKLITLNQIEAYTYVI